MDRTSEIDRRSFIRNGVGVSMGIGMAALADRSAAAQEAADEPAREPAAKRIKVAVIGCGSVSHKYLPHLAKAPYVELVSTCDIIPQRAKRQGEAFKVPNHYPHIDQLLAGTPFDLLVNLTDMQEHERLNRRAIEAGKHLWSEKPIANSLAAGQELLELARKKGTRLWGAPTVVNSPQFGFMAKTLAAKTLGRVACAHASYGHLGPDWSPFFYEKGGGSLPDLGVYNLTTLTGLLGPAKSVVAMTSVVTPSRKINKDGSSKHVPVTAEDNAMVLIDHAEGVMSHTQCGFNYFTAREHDYTDHGHHTIDLVGTEGSMHLRGYDWAPHGVDLATREQPKLKAHATDKSGYVWEQGASVVAECLATGKEPPFTPEHALHVVEVMTAARESQETGRRIAIRSTFKWPVFA